MNIAVQNIGIFWQAMKELIDEIDTQGIDTAQGQALLVGKRSAVLAYFDDLIAQRRKDTQQIIAVTPSLERPVRLFYTDMLLINQDVIDFYLRWQNPNNHVGDGRIHPSKNDKNAECLRLYALLVHCREKQRRLLQCFERAQKNSGAEYA